MKSGKSLGNDFMRSFLLLIDKMPLCDYKSYLKQFFKDQISLDLAIAREA